MEAKALLITVLNCAILALSLIIASTVESCIMVTSITLIPTLSFFVIFINFKSEIFAEGQSFVVHSGLREAFAVSSVA